MSVPEFQISFIPGSLLCPAWFQEGKIESLVTPEKLISRNFILKFLYSFAVMMVIVKIFICYFLHLKKILKFQQILSYLLFCIQKTFYM